MKASALLALVLSLFSVFTSHAQNATKPAKQAAASGYKNVGVEDFDKLRADKKNVILDVRTPKEFSEGHIPGAINIDWNAPDFAEKVAKLDRSKTYLVHCAAGGRSAKACDKLSKMNFTNAINLEGGMRAWEKAGKSVEK